MSATMPRLMPMLGRSFRNLVSKPATRLYPVEVRPPFPGARGQIAVDIESCVFCGLCARKCPTVAIAVAREHKRLTIEHLRCIACGVCVDACNKDSLRMETSPRRVYTHAEAGAEGEAPAGREEHVQLAPPPKPAAPASEPPAI